MLNPEIKDLLSEFNKFSLRPPAWTYAHATYPLKKKGYIFASDRHDPFIYDPDLGRYVPADDRLRSILADSMKNDWTPARVKAIFTWYKDRSPKLWNAPPLRPTSTSSTESSTSNPASSSHTPPTSFHPSRSTPHGTPKPSAPPSTGSYSASSLMTLTMSSTS